MPIPEGERIATLERALVDMSRDLQERLAEEARTRDRLHKLEGAVGLLVENQTWARQQEARQYRRIELRMQWLSVAVSIGSVIMAAAVLVTNLLLGR